MLSPVFDFQIEDVNTIRSPDHSPAMLMLLVPILKSYHRFHSEQEIEASGIQYSQMGSKAQNGTFSIFRSPFPVFRSPF